MKIAYNPKTATAITADTAKNDDIIFDLNAQQVWAKGVLMGVNSKSVDGFSVTSQDGFKYVSSKSIDVTTSGTLYATITTKNLYYNNMLHFKIVASYCNIMGVTYVDHYSQQSGIVVKQTTYNGNNIQGVSREPYNSQYLYLKITGPDMSKATKGTITVYSTVPLSSFALSSEDPGYVWYGVVGGVDGNVPIDLEHIKNANNLYLPAYDVNSRNIQPNNTGIASLKAVKPFFVENKNYTIDSGTKGTYGDFLVLDTYSDQYGGSPNALLFDKNNQNIWHFKGNYNGSTWNRGKRLAYATELQSYLPLTGGTLTGSLIINPRDITSGTDSTEILKIYSSTGYKSGLSISSVDNLTTINAKPFGTGTKTNALQINTYNDSSPVNAIRITAGGLVGIGTTAPANTLEVNGTGKFAKQLTLAVDTGTAPMSVTSTTQVDNLNVDLLDGHHFADIQVGGRNYYSQSKIEAYPGSITKDKTIHGYQGTVSSAGNIRIQKIGMDGIISNWTVSFYIKAATACTAVVDLCDIGPSTLYNESGTIDVTTSYVKHIFTFLNVNKYHDSSSGFNGFLDIFLSAANTIYVKDIKIERGTIATDWSLAPEDLVDNLALLDSSNFQNYFTAGSNISLTNDGGKCKITATNTWRTVNVNSASINQNTLNLCNGSYVTVTKDNNGKVTFDVDSTCANNWNDAWKWVETVTTADSDKTINKWQEIVDFLANIDNSDTSKTLNTLLNSKLAIYTIANNTDISTIKNTGVHYSTSDTNSGTLTNSPFDNNFALLNINTYDIGNDLRRARLAFNAYGEIKISNDRELSSTSETWHTVLTSKNSSIDTETNTIKINNTSLTVSLSDHTHDSSYVKKSGDTMSGALSFSSDYTINDLRIISNDTVKTNHQLQLGYSGNNKVDWYEYGGIWNFYSSKDGANALLVKLAAASQFNGTLTINNDAFGSLIINRTHASAAASITFKGGTTSTSTYGSIGFNVNAKDKQLLRWESDTSKAHTILDTSSTYVTNGTGYINGTEITNAKKLNKWFSSRVADLNQQFGDGALRIFNATSSTTANKCPADASILHLAWDNSGGYETQLALAPISQCMYFRGQSNGTWGAWKTVLDTSNSSVSGNTIIINGAKTTWQNTWRTIKINSSSIDQNELNLIAGTNVTLSRTNGNVTISSPNTWRSIYVNNTSNSLGSNAMTIANGTNTNATLTNNNTVKINLNSALTGITSISGEANDYWRIKFTCTNDDGALEIATADNGNEPIYVRQYKYSDSSTAFGTVARTLTLLDGSGNTILPGTLTTTQVKTSGGIIHTGLYNSLYSASTETDTTKRAAAALEGAKNYYLTAGGTYKPINTVMSTVVATYSIDMAVTDEWKDITNFVGNVSTFINATGTYIVQIIASNVVYSGVMSWSTAKSTADSTDEIVLHRGGGGYTSTIYLRTKETSGNYMTMQISANKTLSSTTYKFNFQRIC